MITAVLGWMIFGEKLPGMWWIGAGMLAVGNVVIGRREEGDIKGKGEGQGEGEGREEVEGLMRGDGDLVELDEEVDAHGDGNGREQQWRLRTGQEVDAPI